MNYKLIALAVIILIVIIFVYWYTQPSSSSFTYTTGYAYPSGVSTAVQMAFYDTQVQLVAIQDWCMAMSRVYNAFCNICNLGDFSADFNGLTSVVTGGTTGVFPVKGALNTNNIIYGTLINFNYGSGDPDSVYLYNIFKGSQFQIAPGTLVDGFTAPDGNNPCDIVSANFFGYPGSTADAFSAILKTQPTGSDATLTAAIGNSSILNNAISFPTTLYNILTANSAAYDPPPLTMLYNLCSSVSTLAATCLGANSTTTIPAGTFKAGTLDVTYLTGAFIVAKNAPTKTANMTMFIYYMMDLISAAGLIINYDPIVFSGGVVNVTSYKNFNIFSKLNTLIPANAAIASLASYPNYNGVVGLPVGLSTILTAALDLKNSLAAFINYIVAQQYLCNAFAGSCNMTLQSNDLTAVGNSIITDGTKFYSMGNVTSTSAAPLSTTSGAINTIYLDTYDQKYIYNATYHFTGGNTCLMAKLNSIITVPQLIDCIAALNSLTATASDQQAVAVMEECLVLITNMPLIITKLQNDMIADTNYAQYRMCFVSIANDIVSSAGGVTWKPSVGYVSSLGTAVTPALTPGSNPQPAVINTLTTGDINGTVTLAPPVPCADVAGLLAGITTLKPPSKPTAAIPSSGVIPPGYNPITTYLSNFIVASNKTAIPSLNAASSAVTQTDVNNFFSLGMFLLWAETIIFGNYQTIPAATDFVTVPYSGSNYAILDTINAYNKSLNA